MKIYLPILLSLFLFSGPKEIKQPETTISINEKPTYTILENILNSEDFLAGLVSFQSEYIKCHLTIDHQFNYSNPMVNYKISVTGRIPVHYDESFAVRVNRNNVENIELVSILSGRGTVKVSGRGSINAGSFQVKKINYDSQINIDINGKTRFLNHEGGVISVMNLALEENWNGDLNWDIETSDPENDDLRYDMLKNIVPTKIPDSPHTGRTLEFAEGYLYKDQTFEHVSSIPGMGTFRWRYTIIYNIAEGVASDRPVLDPINPEKPAHYVKVKIQNTDVNPDNEQSNYDDNQPKPEDFVKDYEPRLGPPLESIEWEIVDLDKL